MKSRLTKIVLACGAALAMSACSSQQVMKAQDSLAVGADAATTAQIPAATQIAKVTDNNSFITERSLSVEDTESKKVNDNSTVNAMVNALVSEMKQKQMGVDDDFHKELLNIQKQYNADMAGIDTSEYESTKHSINIGILKAQSEINQVQSENITKCPKLNDETATDGDDSVSDGKMDDVVSMESTSMVADGASQDTQTCDDVSDHLASLHNDLDRFELELKSTEAKEQLFKFQEQLKIEKNTIRERIAARKNYELESAKVKIDTDVKTLMVQRMHEADDKFSASITSTTDLVDLYSKQLDDLADYSDDEF